MDIAVIIPTWNPQRAIENADLLLSLSRGENVKPVLVAPMVPQTTLHRVVPTGRRFGVVPAMAKGGAEYRKTDLLMFLHDDVKILQEGWDREVADLFRQDKHCGLVGFGGATGLGHLDIYKIPYELNQLARHNFISNMEQWDLHGLQCLQPQKVAVLDGFCLIFSRKSYEEMGGWDDAIKWGMPPHHMYDFWACCRMAELNYHVWFLPIHCHHHGGLTATTAEYDEWARHQGFNGDKEIHQKAHEVCYERFRDVLPIRVFND